MLNYSILPSTLIVLACVIDVKRGKGQVRSRLDEGERFFASPATSPFFIRTALLALLFHNQISGKILRGRVIEESNGLSNKA